MICLGLPLQDGTTLIKMSDNEALLDVFKKEVIEKSEDPLKIDEKGEMFYFNCF